MVQSKGLGVNQTKLDVGRAGARSGYGGKMKIQGLTFSKLSVFATLLMTGVAQAWAVESVGEMLSKCRPIAEAKIDGDKVSYEQSLGTEECWGAFSAIQGLSNFYSVKKPVLNICAPSGANTVQFVAVFVEYAKANPKTWHEPYLPKAVNSLVRAFPCPNR